MKTAEVIKETQRGCPDCHKVGENIEPEPLYECGTCGNDFTRSNSADGEGHRCPTCNVFSAKISDEACPDCNVELEDLDTYIYKDKTYTDDDVDDLIKDIKDNSEALPEFLQEVNTVNKENRQKAEVEQKQRELKEIAEQKKHREFKTVEEVEQAFNDFLNSIQSPLLKLVQSKHDNWGIKQYIIKDEDGNIRWHLKFEVATNFNDRYVQSDTPMNKTDEFYSDIDEASMKYMGMKPDWNNNGTIGWYFI